MASLQMLLSWYCEAQQNDNWIGAQKLARDIRIKWDTSSSDEKVSYYTKNREHSKVLKSIIPPQPALELMGL